MLSTIVILALFGGCVMAEQAIYRCDPTIVSQAKSYWAGSNNDVLNDAIANGLQVLKAETPGYLTGDSTLQCASIYYQKNDGSVFTTAYRHLVYLDGTTEDTTVDLLEGDGVILKKSSDVKGYSVYSGNGILATYACYDDDSVAVGPPASYILTSQDGYNQVEYQTAYSRLQAIGAAPTVFYPDTCSC